VFKILRKSRRQVSLTAFVMGDTAKSFAMRSIRRDGDLPRLKRRHLKLPISLVHSDRSMQHHLIDLLSRDGVYDPREMVRPSDIIYRS
jgi:hypothetical protein